MKNQTKIAAALGALSLLAALPATALTVSSDVVTGTSGYTSGSSGVTGPEINANVNVSGKLQATSSSSGTNASSNTAASGSADLSIPLVVTRADITSNAVTATNVAAVNVKDQNDLSGYVAAQLRDDANLSAVDTASDRVAVTYSEPAKLFGFVPVTIDTTATVDQSGNVTISYPWWSYLASTDSAGVQAKVQSNVSGVVNSNAQASGGFSAAQQAELIASLKSALAAEANASATATVSGSTNVQ